MLGHGRPGHLPLGLIKSSSLERSYKHLCLPCSVVLRGGELELCLRCICSGIEEQQLPGEGSERPKQWLCAGQLCCSPPCAKAWSRRDLVTVQLKSYKANAVPLD